MRLVPSISIAVIFPATLSLAPAVEFGPDGPRSLGMGGTRISLANDALMMHHNPAFLGTAPRTRADGETPSGRHGVNVIDLTAGVTLSGRIGDYLDTIANIDIDEISDIPPGELTSSQLEDVLKLTAALGGLDRPGNGLIVSASSGSGVRWGSFAIGARLRGQAAVRVDELDTANIGFENLDLDAINADIAALANGQTGSVFSQQERDRLAAAGLEDGNIDYLDFVYTALVASGEVQAQDISEAIDLLAQVVEISEIGGGSLDDNTTVVTGRGIGIAEIPISYGYAVTPEFSLGVTLRLMIGRIYGTTVLVFDDDNDQVLDDIDENYNTSTAVTFDLGARYQYGRFTFAAVGRNLTRPTFKGFTTTNGILIDDVTLDPQVTLGASVLLPSRLSVALEGDLLTVDSMLHGLEERYVRLGVEWDPIRVLELRAGAWKNVAQSSQSWVLTAGLGLDFGLLRFDLAAGISPSDRVRYDDRNYPEIGFASFGISAGF